ASDYRWFPGAVEHRLVGPIGAEPDREIPARRWQPVGFLILARRLIAKIDGKRAVRVVFQSFVLRAERKTIDRIRVKEVFGVVDRQRPKAPHRRKLPLRESNSIGRLTYKLLRLRVVVSIEVRC